ncbi:unnamed protein product [Rotaria sp. Silwood1]|nr:unnamed protein product [Rotaria sp. Silwood1]CAF1181083.1 unnamed protein product [Rotaria sp. Silwood1]CAF3435879.1 unnamed protein product [Rotaria sp. Silwood1]CAF3496192.1 unnamed protein product [Rotaria sp. Silwood1]CAF4810029.1 unnamed protein product [Rotaria sp. Silwood1]
MNPTDASTEEVESLHQQTVLLDIPPRLQWDNGNGYCGETALQCIVGDSLQGSYRYALYDSYQISRSPIELLYVISYGSSLFIGTFAASLADRYGRRWACFLSASFYILQCFLLNFSTIWILVIGNIFWGIANAFYHTGFEAWLIQEHRGVHACSALVSIGTGVFAQLLVQLNVRIVLLGLSSALFDASLHMFIIEWTPILQRARSVTGQTSLPLGFIFAVYRSFDMIGSFMFGPMAKHIQVQSYMILKLPEEQAFVCENHILVDEPSSPLFNMKRSQMKSFSISLIPQISTKSDDDDQSISGMSNDETCSISENQKKF